ncbi:MAG: tetratricopeptide (TPR) repeat protein [Myxococcota bacterium]|jgi:tetratricopeptide (TPR) repeat protein
MNMDNSPRLMVFAAVIAALALTAGCATSRSSGLCESDVAPVAIEGDLAAVEAAAEAAFLKRESVHSLQTSIDKWRQATQIAPAKADNHLKLARALYFLGDGYLRLDEDEPGMVRALEEATYFAERALRLQNDDFKRAVCGRRPYSDAVKSLRRSDVAAVYWYATALGKYGLATDIVTVLDNKDRIFALISRVRLLNPGFFYGAADRYLGAYYTKIPFPRGDVKKSKFHFDAALEREPNYLGTHVLIAEMLASKYSDRAYARKLAKQHLDIVLKTPVAVIPELVAEHRIEKKKAERLMDDLDTRFPID